MTLKEPNKLCCQICQKDWDTDEVLPADLVRPFVVKTIQKHFPDWDEAGFICFEDLNKFRTCHVEEVLKKEHGEANKLDQTVIMSLQLHEILTEDLNAEFKKSMTLGEHLSDKLAEFGGSWKFISIFAFFLIGWIALNGWMLTQEAIDPFPFILLNLVLSCLAALQAPIIMMSQNRQAAKDRLRSESDYQINLKAELEIRHLKIKIDQLLSHQWRRLLQIQQTQMELMQELSRKADRTQNNNATGTTD